VFAQHGDGPGAAAGGSWWFQADVHRLAIIDQMGAWGGAG